MPKEPIKVLFIGGSGTISSACTEVCIEKGIDLFLLTRGTSPKPLSKQATVLTADIKDTTKVRSLLSGQRFDTVVDFRAYDVDDVTVDFELFNGKIGQFIFISSASIYHKPVNRLPITESTLLHNPYWQYSRDKIAAEEYLFQRYRQDGFPVTVVRPSHTYDTTEIPLHGGYTAIDRLRRGKKVIIHGDGTSLWTLTHHMDFARGFVALLGNHTCIGEAFHITSDEVLTWNQIYDIMAQAAGVKGDYAYVPSTMIASVDREWGEALLGDKTHSVIFDNTKIKSVVGGFFATIPFSTGARQIMQWYDADPKRCRIDSAMDTLMDTLINRFF
ncbi:MAG: NAD-dependent epimerase/dehydratase family protein [Chitinivibrionales bacterium]|nr:NAD-dependent epimerase/dehydratase family protein [Chitinivibrionales bacterium]